MKKSILEQLSSDDFDRRGLDTKLHNRVPDWWKGVTCLAQTAVTRFEGIYNSLLHHRDTTVGLWAFDCKPEELLEKFNASQSDAHSLECGDFEQLNKDWIRFCKNENYFKSPFFQIKDDTRTPKI